MATYRDNLVKECSNLLITNKRALTDAKKILIIKIIMKIINNQATNQMIPNT